LISQAWAQTPSDVYRCDKTYSQTPCEPATRKLDLPSAPAAEQAQARDQLTRQQEQQAQTLEQKRRQDEAATAQHNQRQALSLENQHAQASVRPAPKQSLDQTGEPPRRPASKRKKHATTASPYFTAKPQGQGVKPKKTPKQ
jgi:hypothetical protein